MEQLELILLEIINMLKAERGLIALFDPKMQKLDIFQAHKIDPATFLYQADISQSIINNVYDNGIPILVSDAINDPRFMNTTSIVISGLRSIICVPIQHEKDRLGVIYIDSRAKTGAYSNHHLELLEQASWKLSELIVKELPHVKNKRG